MATTPLTTEERRDQIRKKLDSGVMQIRTGQKYVMFDHKALEKGLTRTKVELAKEGKKAMVRQIRITAAKDL